MGRDRKARKNCIKDHSGFSLVEVIVVIAIMCILAGVSISMAGQIRYANMEKAVELVQTALEKQRILSMSREGDWYLYIYGLSDGCYMKVDNAIRTSVDEIPDKDQGTKICGNNIELYRGLDGKRVAGEEFIRISYSRNGVFNSNTNLFDAAGEKGQILFGDAGQHNVTLYKETGKSFVDEP